MLLLVGMFEPDLAPVSLPRVGMFAFGAQCQHRKRSLPRVFATPPLTEMQSRDVILIRHRLLRGTNVTRAARLACGDGSRVRNSFKPDNTLWKDTVCGLTA